MVSSAPHPTGAGGKQPIAMTLSPNPPLPTTSMNVTEPTGNLNLMKMLVDTIIISNTRFRKLNLHRQRRQLDMNLSQPVSEDENETPILDLNSFSSLPVTSEQNPVCPCTQPSQPLPNLAPPPNRSGLNSIAISSHPTEHTSINNAPQVLPIEWQNLVTGNTVQALTSDPISAKLSVIDYQNIGPIYIANDLTKNKHQLDMSDVPNAILQMAYNKIYIPLSMMTTSALSKIHSNDNLKYHKIPFGNSVGKQSLNEASFPAEDSLTETMFFQSYRN